MAKEAWMHVAEVFDAWRVIPRSFLISWSTFTMYLGWYLVHWYTTQPANERGYEESVALIGVFTAALGFTKFIFDKYSSTGRDWVANPVP